MKKKLSRKSKIYLIVGIIILLIITFQVFKKSNEGPVNKFVDEGCYINEKNDEHLLCFTKDNKFYNVLKHNDKYYNDIHYMSPPINDIDYKKYSYEYEFINQTFILRMLSKSNDTTTQTCIKSSDTTFKCTIEQTISGETKTEESNYRIVDKKFDDEIINTLPKYERTKKYQINFNGEMLQCMLPWSYSIINTKPSNTAIKQCLKKQLDEDYTAIANEDSKDWIIYSDTQKKRIKKLFPGAYSSSVDNVQSNDILGALNYAKLNFGYKVSVNEQAFGFFESFPIDPFNQSEIMTVDIISTKKDPSKEYGLYELKYNKAYIHETEGFAYEFINSTRGMQILYPNDPSIRVESKFTYRRVDNTIFIEYDSPFNEDEQCRTTSNNTISCLKKTYWDELTAK